MYFAPLDYAVLALIGLFAIWFFVRFATQMRDGNIGRALRSLGVFGAIVFIASVNFDNASSLSFIFGDVGYFDVPRWYMWAILVVASGLIIAGFAYDGYVKYIKPRFVNVPRDVASLVPATTGR